MGSTTIGSVNPAVTGLAVPQDIRINRAGFRRVREMVAPHWPSRSPACRA